MPYNRNSKLPPKRGATKARHRMRCSRGDSGCGRRFTLKRHPDQYVRAVRCPHCKSLNVQSVELERRIEDLNRGRCYCGAYPFPHRIGSLTFCRENPVWNDPEFEPSRDDMLAYDRVIATPRSAFA